MEMTGGWSEGVERESVRLSGLLPYEEVAAVMERLGQVHLSTASVWRETQEYGKKFQTLEEQERISAMLPPAQWHTTMMGGEGGRMGVSMDGGMVYIFGEGWKELKVGSVFEVNVQPGVDRESKEPIAMPIAESLSYIAHLGGPTAFGAMVWAEARRRDWWQAGTTQVVADGASWIWNLTTLHFGESVQIVDWYHAKSHLVSAARALHGLEEEAMQRWLKAQERLLYQGHARRIGEVLLAEAQKRPQIADALRTEANYFLKHQRRMQYMAFREEGWVIGSGMVESGIKQYKNRFSGPGMRWSRAGAERLIPIRSAILSSRFDQRWEQIRNLPPN
jgi:hypothetical protein